MSRLYLDSCSIIYLLEGAAPLQADTFLTGDVSLAQCPGLRVEIVAAGA